MSGKQRRDTRSRRRPTARSGCAGWPSACAEPTGWDRDTLKCIEELTEIREDVHRIAAAHGASNVRLIGSTGRGKQDASSNLGLLVDMAEGRTLFDLIALSNELEELGVEMDVVTEASLSPYIRDRVLAEAVALGGDQA